MSRTLLSIPAPEHYRCMTVIRVRQPLFLYVIDVWRTRAVLCHVVVQPLGFDDRRNVVRDLKNVSQRTVYSRRFHWGLYMWMLQIYIYTTLEAASHIVQVHISS